MKDFYYELKVEPQSSLEVFIDLVTALVDDAIEETADAIIIRSEENLDTVQYGIEQFSEQLGIPCVCTLEQKKNEDWVKNYCDSIDPVEIGQFYVRPSWFEAKEDLINIIIDPALAFGSGHHETTSTCLQAISQYVKSGDKAIDVGCGSGILGIAAAKMGAQCDLCDTDPVAIENTKENFVTNNISYDKMWTGSVTQTKEQYDVVIANIVADVLVMISSDLKKSLKDNGILILSGILDKYHDKVLKKYENLELVDTIQKNEWVTLVLRNKH